MIAKWEPKRFIEQLIEFHQRQLTYDQAKAELEEMLGDGDIETLKRDQRIVLLAEAFDYEVLVTVDWLSERYDVDIRCYRIRIAKNENDHFLTCSRAYPPPELDRKCHRPASQENGWPGTDGLGGDAKVNRDQAVVRFFKNELNRGCSNNPKYKSPLRIDVAL